MKKADANKDGKLDLAEFKEFFRECLKNIKFLSPGPSELETGPNMIVDLPHHADIKIKEYMASKATLGEKCALDFRIFDDDNDGKLDQDDVLAFMDKFWNELKLGLPDENDSDYMAFLDQGDSG
mmetsp:Transcript_10346/g.8902  ORF Transcript_10346/g.8902 Transcript_10346/m.8902 type:complete len:124 (-) Transcript_10346:607-978(-)|eukprot:CAMPEP_0114581538 /NCGR_PEP_ID=MMETSP0125-20121206/5638_1 /TAXON_ID=485358 ORGANISM="Aristerostoma sp., Strain ATCC 50986" /NCGR_SAMPLE_ID=MMETSP0125 /ASSEMBLY_ACC=CAM_ASM_000245 /LENGTH=123 /DNA_ID=CAMNT_0001773829 /DNA_START=180 /DNA_END=551 /DNA_ORIENTATION=-